MRGWWQELSSGWQTHARRRGRALVNRLLDMTLGRALLLIWAASCLPTLATAAVPPMPQLPQPGQVSGPGPLLGSSTVQLYWRSVSSATYYAVNVRDLSTMALDSRTVGATSLTVTLQPGREYRWNVAACNGSGCSAQTTALHFRTPQPPRAFTGLAVSCPAAISEGMSATCTALAQFSDNSTQNVTTLASWSENSAFASITGPGVLTTALVSGNQPVTVTASYMHNGAQRAGTASVTIVDVPPPKTLSGVTVACPSSINEGTSGSCTATARFSDNSTQNVTNGASWSENSAFATISGSGVLTAALVTSNQRVTVTASYTRNGVQRAGTASVTVVDVPPPKTLSGVTVACPASINEGATGNCTATARFSDNSTQNVTSGASWSENSAFSTISSAGMLTTAQVTSNQSVTVTASYTYNGSQRAGTASVTIKDLGSEAPPKSSQAPQSGAQYSDLLFAFTWDAGGIPSAGVELRMAGAEVRVGFGSGSIHRFTARSSEVGTRTWQLLSRATGRVLASGSVSVAAAPDFAFKDGPPYVAPPRGGYCQPQCVTFVRHQLGTPAVGDAWQYWDSGPEGYARYPQGSTRAPRPGDVLVWEASVNAGNFGHVALVKSVDQASGTLVLRDANWDGRCSVADATLSLTRTPAGAWTISGSGRTVPKLRGWLSKDQPWPTQ